MKKKKINNKKLEIDNEVNYYSYGYIKRKSGGIVVCQDCGSGRNDRLYDKYQNIQDICFVSEEPMKEIEAFVTKYFTRYPDASLLVRANDKEARVMLIHN